MRGSDTSSGAMFSYVDLEARVPAKHPLRVIKQIVDDALASLDADFERLYQGTGRSSIAPERLLRASLLQAFYSVRSERQLVEQLDYNLLFRWFVGLGIDDPVWDHSTFSKNRDRLLDADVAASVGRRTRNQTLFQSRQRSRAKAKRYYRSAKFNGLLGSRARCPRHAVDGFATGKIPERALCAHQENAVAIVDFTTACRDPVFVGAQMARCDDPSRVSRRQEPGRQRDRHAPAGMAFNATPRRRMPHRRVENGHVHAAVHDPHPVLVLIADVEGDAGKPVLPVDHLIANQFAKACRMAKRC